jgi:Carboxypeptidase regulatory-like domain
MGKGLSMSNNRILTGFAVLVFLTTSMFGQVAGRVTGLVVDATGAAIANATVNLQIAGSDNKVFSTVTTSTGDFTLLSVRADSYDLVVEAPGFLKSIVKGLKVDPGRETSVPQIKLDVASVTSSVEVTGTTQSVQTSNAELSTTITSSQIQNLPVINRSPLGFIQTQVGVNSGRGSTTINGQRPTFVSVTLDGVNIQDNFIRTNDVDFLPNLLLLDQVSELTVSTSNTLSAAGGGSAQVSFVTPSGGNQFHGNAYWSNRNNYFAANTWFNNQSGVKRPFLNQNQIGGSVGGHIIRNKLFFYTNYELFRLRQVSSQNHTILTADARQGIFTYRDAGGAVQKVNVLQAAGIQPDPVAASLLAQVPGADKINNFLVGDSSNTLSRNTAGYSFLKRNNRTRDNVTGKIDYVPSVKHSFTWSYIWNRDILDRPDQDSTFSLVPLVSNSDYVKLMSSSWRWSPRPNLTNEARFGFNWAPAIFLDSQKIPDFFVTGTTYTNPQTVLRTQGRNTDTYNFADNASYVRGTHTFQFGFQGQRDPIEQYNDAGITPSYALGIGTGNQGLTPAQLPGASASDQNAANGLLATLAGYLTSYTQTLNVTTRTSGYVKGATNLRHDTSNNYAIYGMDSWKASRRVTLTLGLRWDYFTTVDERDALALLPVLQNNNPIQTLLSNATLDFAGSAVGRPWYKSDKNNFAPNLGVAWDLFGDGKTALRAGYAISFVNDNIVRAVDNSQGTNAGLQTTVSQSGLSGRLGSGVPAIPVPAFKVPLQFSDIYALNSQAAFAMPDPSLVTPYVQQWNVGVQHSVKGMIVEARYVGNHGTKEIRGIDYNQVLIGSLLPDFLKAQSNGFLAQSRSGTFDPRFNANIPGSQQLPFFNQLPSAGLLTNATILNLIQTGQVGELAATYQVNHLNGPVNFFTNPYALGTNLTTNFSNSSFHALQIDVNRRFSHGLQFQANYQFSRLLSDTAGNGQTNFEPLLDINNARIERSRPSDFDITHVFKANGVYELPLGPGHRLNYSPLSRVLGGWNIAGIFTRESGAPFSVFSTRGTLNRAARSGVNTVNTSLNKSQLDQLFQFRMTGSSPYIVAASAIGPDGRAVAADGAAPFAGQVFFQPGAGTLGSLQRNYFSGPWVYDLDFHIAKVTHITERQTVELRMDASNVFNHPTWSVGDQTVTSTTFGKITNNFFGRRLVQFALFYRF